MEIRQRRDYIKLLESLYSDKKVSGSNIFGVNWWPVIRIQSAYFLHLIFVGRPVSDSEKKTLVYKEKKAFPLKDLLVYLKSAIELFFTKKKFSGRLKTKVLIAGFEKHKIDLNGKKVNIYAEPFVDAFTGINVPSEIIWLDKADGNLERFLGLLKRHFAAKASLQRSFSSFYNNEYKKVYALSLAAKEYFDKKGIAFADNIGFRVQKSIIENEITYQAAIEFLKITAPLQVLDYCYYNNSMMALQRAANYLSIPVTEYQHSIQADDHLAYAPWKESDNYAVFFPSQFWVWSNDDRERIKTNFYGNIYNPSIIIGGNVFLAQQKSDGVKDESADKAVLITLQGSWIPQFIEEVIKKRKDLKWYFRLHPRYPDDKEKLAAFNKLLPENVEMELANKLPLYTLFQKVKFNITSSSGTALEAPAFKVTNFIFGQDGYNCFESYITSNQFYFIEDADTLERLLDAQIENNLIDTSADMDGVRNSLKGLYHETAL